MNFDYTHPEVDRLRTMARELIQKEAARGITLTVSQAVARIKGQTDTERMFVDYRDPQSIRDHALRHIEREAAEGRAVEYAAAVDHVVRCAKDGEAGFFANNPILPVKASTADAARALAEAITQTEKDQRIAATSRKLADLMVDVDRGARDGMDAAVVAEITRLTQAYAEARDATVKPAVPKPSGQFKAAPLRPFYLSSGEPVRIT